MNKIFYLMGKSASGKDTIYELLKGDPSLNLRTVVLYTTRPMRSGEVEGVTYHFVSTERLKEILDSQTEKKSLIELRTYQTIHGPWSYFTLDDGQFNLEKEDIIMVGTLESYHAMKEYFSGEKVVPLYIEVEDGERLTRALAREKKQDHPKYEEMCRRFLADQKDFSEERLAEEGVVTRYPNKDLDTCLQLIREAIRKVQ